MRKKRDLLFLFVSSSFDVASLHFFPVRESSDGIRPSLLSLLSLLLRLSFNGVNQEK